MIFLTIGLQREASHTVAGNEENFWFLVRNTGGLMNQSCNFRKKTSTSIEPLATTTTGAVAKIL
jgi:hypothetical protein